MSVQSFVAVLMVGAAALGAGCGYDCHAKCLEIEDELKYRNRETGLIDLEDPCDQQELRDARSCEECEKAFVEVFQEVAPVVTCDCIETSEYNQSDAVLLGYYDTSCEFHADQFSSATCEDYAAAELGDWETCAEQEQES